MVPLVCTALLLSTVTNSQVGRTHLSLESLVGDSETVVVGQITQLEFKLPAGKLDNEWAYITLQIDKTIKGKTRKSIQLVSQSIYGKDVYMQWMQFASELIVFVPYREAGEFHDPTIQRLDNTDDGDLKKPYLRKWRAMFSMDFYLLDSRDAILDAAHKFMKKNKGRVAVLQIADCPPIRSHRLQSPGDVNTTHLPNVPEVKNMATEMVEHPERWLDRHSGAFDFLRNKPMTPVEVVQRLGAGILAAIEKAQDGRVADRLLRPAQDDGRTGPQ